jgi:hypothetical protein
MNKFLGKICIILFLFSIYYFLRNFSNHVEYSKKLHFNKVYYNYSALNEKIYQNKLKDFLIITITNFGYREFTHNWILNMKKLDLNKFLVFCYDKKVFDYFKTKGFEKNFVEVPNEWVHSVKLTDNFVSFGSKEYIKIVRAKSNVWYELLRKNHSILFSDPDVVIYLFILYCKHF